MKRPVRSRKHFARAAALFPGGVNSPVRAFQAVGGMPLFVRRARGATIEDVDGNRFIDYVMSWGPLIHGHAPPGLVRATAAAAGRGLSFGAPSPLEHELAERVRGLVPSMERMRFVSSGTEAVMSALRVARAFTGRDRVVKFSGCYHGHADAFLVKAGSGATTFGVPTSPGVPRAVAADTLVARYNDLASVDAICRAEVGRLAAVVVEPIAGNMGVVPPVDGFLDGLRRLCTDHGIVLIFDEVISGFRASAGGAQAVFGVVPDLTCLGKIIGGGLPVGAYGGRAAIMNLVAPAGPVYQAGTLSGNPVAMTAGLWSLKRLSPGLYRRLARLGAELAAGLAGAARDAGVALQINAFGSLLTPFFTTSPVRDYESALTSDTGAYAAFFRGMLARGVFPPPSQFEAWFLSAAHTERDVKRTVAAAHEAMKEVAAREKEGTRMER
jgi:glutamate-1-semialdehyde 2,1-aminomutase